MHIWQRLPLFWRRVLRLLGIALIVAILFGAYNVLRHDYPFLRAMSDAFCFSALILAALTIFPLFKDMGRGARILRSNKLTHEELGVELAHQREEREAEMRLVWAMLTAAGFMILISLLLALFI